MQGWPPHVQEQVHSPPRSHPVACRCCWWCPGLCPAPPAAEVLPSDTAAEATALGSCQCWLPSMRVVCPSVSVVGAANATLTWPASLSMPTGGVASSSSGSICDCSACSRTVRVSYLFPALGFAASIASFLAASWSSSVSTAAGGTWTYLITVPRTKMVFTESCTDEGACTQVSSPRT